MTYEHRFTCEEAFRKLDDFLDHELSAGEMRLFREHLASCARCASEHRFEATLLSGVRAKAQSFQVPPSLLAKVFLRLAQQTGSEPNEE